MTFPRPKGMAKSGAKQPNQTSFGARRVRGIGGHARHTPCVRPSRGIQSTRAKSR